MVNPSPVILRPPNYLPDPIWRFPNGGLRCRPCPQANDTVDVFWEGEQKFFRGLVEWCVGEKGLVVYEDGDEEEVDFGRMWWRKIVGDEELYEVKEGGEGESEDEEGDGVEGEEAEAEEKVRRRRTYYGFNCKAN